MARGRELVVPPLGPRSHTIKLARARGCGYSVAVGTRYSGGGKYRDCPAHIGTVGNYDAGLYVVHTYIAQ